MLKGKQTSPFPLPHLNESPTSACCIKKKTQTSRANFKVRKIPNCALLVLFLVPQEMRIETLKLTAQMPNRALTLYLGSVKTP